MEEKKQAVSAPIVKKDIAISIILSIVTCGIYGIYWFITLTEDINTLSDDHKTSGGLAFVLTLVTCGIYGIYWIYNLGKRMVEYQRSKGEEVDDSIVILYVVLQVFGWGIVTYALLQDRINKYAN